MPLPRIALPSFSDSAVATSRCFRTDADGRIPLRRDWPALFRAVASFDAVAFQSRHACARLIHYGSLPDLRWCASGENARDHAGVLHLRCATWGDAWGRIAPCNCCGSPGRIEILNTHHAEFLQLCSASDQSPAQWAACLGELATPPTPAPSAARAADGFNLLPDDLRLVATSGNRLPVLFSILQHENIPFRALLRTPEMTHLRTFTARHVFNDPPLLTVSDGRTTLQLALPPVRMLALASDDSLHVAGSEDTLLLSLAAGEGESCRWSAAICALFEL